MPTGRHCRGWHVSLSVETDNNRCQKPQAVLVLIGAARAVGIDSLIVTSDGETVENPKHLRSGGPVQGSAQTKTSAPVSVP